MRYVLCDMQTGMQDIRLPVQAISPYTGDPVDLATRASWSQRLCLCPTTGREFDVLGTMPDVPSAKLVSDRFEVGRNFRNKLLNAVRLRFLNLQDAAFTPRQYQDLADEDRWILSRLALPSPRCSAIWEAIIPRQRCRQHVTISGPSSATGTWNSSKPRLRDAAGTSGASGARHGHRPGAAPPASVCTVYHGSAAGSRCVRKRQCEASRPHCQALPELLSALPGR